MAASRKGHEGARGRRQASGGRRKVKDLYILHNLVPFALSKASQIHRLLCEHLRVCAPSQACGEPLRCCWAVVSATDRERPRTAGKPCLGMFVGIEDGATSLLRALGAD